LVDDSEEPVLTPEFEAAVEWMRQEVASGMSPGEVANRVFEAIKGEKFYILTHPEMTPYVQARMEAIVGRENPPSIS